ncbi:MAG: PRC-barrel domain-containing protein [Candidatus Dormibacteraceae bacterium]
MGEGARAGAASSQEETMVETPDFREWIGDDVRSSGGDKIGNLEDVYYDADTGEPVFLLVKSGLLGRRLTFVPTERSKPGRAYLAVAYPDAEIKQAPTVDAGADLSTSDEERLYNYYKMSYQPHGSGRRLVRR